MKRAWLAVALAAAVLGAGCGSRKAPAKAPEKPAPFGRVDGSPDGRRWLSPDAARARQQGASDVEIVAVDQGAAGDRISGMLRVPAESCVLLIARAAASVEDVDLFAYGDDGTVLGVDEAQDKTPTLLVCPPHPRHVYVAARIAAGHGLVAIGAQRVAPADAQKIGKAIGARQHPGDEESRLVAWTGLDERLAQHRRQIGSTWQDVRRVALPLDPQVPMRVSAMVEENRCLDILVLPSEDVSYLDVSVLDATGRGVGRAAANGRERSLVVCSPTQAPVTIEIRPHSGRGLAVLILSRSAVGGHQDLDVDAVRFDLAEFESLPESRAKHAARLQSAGYRRPELVGEGALEVGRRSSLKIDLPARCVRLDVITGAPVQGLQAWLWADDGSLIAERRGSGKVALFACTKGGSARLDTEALLRPGRYAVEMRDEPDTPALLRQHPLAAGRLLSRMLSRGVIRSASQVGAPRVVLLEPSRLHALDILVPLGRCVELTLALGPGASGAEVRLIDKQRDVELDLVRGTYSASARSCALERSDTLFVRAEMRVTAGKTSALVATRMLAPRP